MGALLLSRRFAPLFWCQFFSAFVDNFLKNALVFLILFQTSGSEALITLAAAVFIAPFFFLSGLGGELADRYDKSVIARRLKFSEIGAAIVAIAGFELQSVPVLFGALFLFGVIAALFGPIKYGILPDHLARHELPAGNALVEAATFIAILLGTVAGGLAMADGGHPVLLGGAVMVFSLLCFASSRFIPPTGEAAPALTVRANILASTAAMVRHLRGERRLWWGGLTTSWFWLMGAVALSLLPPLVKNVIGGNEQVVTACLALFSIGIGIGSALAAKIAAGRIVLTPTLVGSVLMGIFALDLGWSSLGREPAMELAGIAEVFSTAPGIRLAIDLFGLAVAGGLYIVPVFAAVQAWAGPAFRARTVAAVNVLNAAFMAGSAIMVALLQIAGLTTSALFAILGAASLAVAALVAATRPTATN